MKEPGQEIPDPSPFDLEAWANQFESMTWLDRIRFVTEGGVHLVAGLLGSAADEAAAVVARARKSFRQGLDPNILEAHILDERPVRRAPESPAPPAKEDHNQTRSDA